MSRRTARKQAFLTLYQSDVRESLIDDELERWRSYRGDFEAYADELTHGVERERIYLDARIAEVSEGWPIHRMNAVDRTILRLALYEMLHVDDVPLDVAVNEAVELARGFSGEDSPAFVSGVLRGVAGRTREDERGRVEHG